jgi:hypothetical protein
MLQVNFWFLTILILCFDDLVAADLEIRIFLCDEHKSRTISPQRYCHVLMFQAFMEFVQEVAVLFAAHIQ